MSDTIQISSSVTALYAKEINARIKEILDRKAESVTKNEPLRQALGYIYLDYVTPFVPLSEGRPTSGRLRGSGKVTTRGRVIWSAVNRGDNYADIQYNTQYEHYTTPGTGPYWTKHVNPKTSIGAENWSKFIHDDEVQHLILQAYKNG